MSYNSTVQQDSLVAPVRTYDQVVAIMRAKGDEKITRQHIYYYEQSAFRKIRDAMPTVERFLQAAGIKPASWHETVPEQIERGIKRVEEMRKFKFPNEVILFCENIKAAEAAKEKQ